MQKKRLSTFATFHSVHRRHSIAGCVFHCLKRTIVMVNGSPPPDVSMDSAEGPAFCVSAVVEVGSSGCLMGRAMETSPR